MLAERGGGIEIMLTADGENRRSPLGRIEPKFPAFTD